MGQTGPPKYSNLDLIKAETPLTPTKISKMLHQLEFKLRVEMQYKEGIDKMAKLYQADGDKKSKADAETKKIESEKKIQLLQTALKTYKNLHILDEVEEEEDPSESSNTPFAISICSFSQKMVQAPTVNARTICGRNLYRELYRLLFRALVSLTMPPLSPADRDRPLNK
jgi:hypothetical protein